ncbi:IS3 family transposase [Halomonas sp. 3F2F]|uniref:IS3 family transposase n=1 Tax=Halomonas sp. 3F2F TaxID=1255602 RepID=UPI001D01DA39|nr:IS3 family transposase [Halomonas sp. 3F2F]
MSKQKRNTHSPELKAKVALEAVRGLKTANEIAQEFGVHPVQVGQWKKALLADSATLFDKKRGPKPKPEYQTDEKLYGEIGRLKMELDWLKKKFRDQPAMIRRGWIDATDRVPLLRQCALAGIARSTVYAQRQLKMPEDLDIELCHALDEIYTRWPFYGSRRMVVELGRRGFRVNRKRVQRLMRGMGLAGMAPGPMTSRPHPEHKIHPYLLRGVSITRPNQVWSTDVTYIRLAYGFVYLVAIIDWYSRKVLSWRLSNTMDADFCVDALESALRLHGTPEIFNSDQGSQFTSQAFTGVLKDAGIAISMDGRGRAFDNIFVERLWRTVKYEDVYLKGYARLGELTLGLSDYFAFYNTQRPHQSLGNRTPDDVYQSGLGGGASIPDHFGSQRVTPQDQDSGQRCAAAPMVEAIA